MGVATVTVLSPTSDGLVVLILFGVGVLELGFKSDDLFKVFVCCWLVFPESESDCGV